MSMSEKLRDALRKKFRSPQEALQQLGLDSALLDDKEAKPMTTVLSPKAMYAKGRISQYLLPRLAADTALDLNPILAPVTAKNWRAQQPIVESAIRRVTRGNLAQDADVDDLVQLLDAIGETREGEDDLELNAAIPMRREDDDDEDEWRADHDYRARDARRRLGRDETEEEMKAREERESATDAKRRLGRDESPEEADDRRARDAKWGADRRAKDEAEKKEEESKKAEDDPPPFKGKLETGGAITQSAMDAALARQRAEILAEAREVQLALDHVRPRVGALNLAFDSAEAVYRHTLEVLGVPEAKTIHATALKTVLDLLPRPSAKPALIATDAAGVKSFVERFPHAAATKISY